MPFIIPQAEFTATNQSALNAQEATKLVVELKAEEPYGSIFCGLAVKWAATKSLCLDKALQEDKDFKAALSLYFNASIKTLRGIVLKTVKTAVEEGRIELLKADFIKLDAALAPLLKKEKPPEKKAASVASTSVSKLAAALKPAIVLATPDVPAATPSLAGILAHRGYWEANRAFYPGDLDRALRGYVDDVAKQHVGKDGYITVINGTKFLWREDLSTVASSMLRVAKETQKQQTEELIKAVKKALKAGSNKIYIPINNGSGHFVFIDIKKAADGNVKVELKDSMDPDAHNVSAAHKRNNQDLVDILVAHIQEDLDSAGKQASGEVIYGRVQGEDAKCPFHAVFELVKACSGEPGFAPTDPLMVAAATGSLRKFEEAMAQKILNLSPEHKMTKEEVESVQVDEFGILCKTRPKTTAQYDAYRANIHFQYNMSFEVYNKISQICGFLQTVPETKMEDLHRRAKEWIKSDGSSIAAVIKRLTANSDLIPEGLPITDILKGCCRPTDITKTIVHDSKAEQFCVDGVQLDGGMFTPETIAKHVLKTANTALLVSGGEDKQLTLTFDTLVLVPKFGDFDKHGVDIEDYIKHMLNFSGIAGLSLKKYEESGAKQIRVVLECKKQDESAALQKLQSLIEVTKCFNPALNAVVAAELEKLKPKKPELKVPPPDKHKKSAASTVFTVFSSGSVLSRGQIFSAPTASAAGKAKVPEFLLAREVELKTEMGRRQLHHWFDEKSPPVKPAPTAKDEKALPKQQAREVTVKQYFAVEPTVGTAAVDLLKNRELKQCGVIETCVKPGEETRLELILPAKTDLGKTENFNTVLFDFIHRAVQDVIKKQGGNVPGRKHVIKLEEVHTLDLRLSSAEVALLQYCHFMGYDCQTARNQPVNIEKVLDQYKKPKKDPTHPFYEALKQFIDDQAAQEAKNAPDLIVTPAPPHHGMI